ncbi:MAG: NAD(P)-dependent oxidoreductase [Candidatus Omnitrophota bacterium]
MNKSLGKEFLPHADSFSNLRGKRIFLTGGTGFFGKNLLTAIAAMNGDREKPPVEVMVLSRHPEKFRLNYPEFGDIPKLSFLVGDVRDFPFPEGHFDYILHGATESSSTLERDDPDAMYSVIVEGTRRMLDFSVKAEVSRFMIISSGAVYGLQPPAIEYLPETYTGAPVTVYGKGKLRAEEMCVEAGGRHGFTVLLPRCFAFVGPYLNLEAHFAIGNFIRDCLENRPITVKGDGTPLRSYLYTADLVEWLLTILSSGLHARPYHVGSAEAISISDLAHLVRTCAGTTHPIKILGAPVTGALPSRYVPSVERAASELGLRPRYSLKEAITQTLAWHLNPHK